MRYIYTYEFFIPFNVTASLFTFQLTDNSERVSFTAPIIFQLPGNGYLMPYSKRNNQIYLFCARSGRTKNFHRYSLSLENGRITSLTSSLRDHDSLPEFEDIYPCYTTFFEESALVIAFLRRPLALTFQKPKAADDLWLFYPAKDLWKSVKTFHNHSIICNNGFGVCVSSEGTAFVHGNCSHPGCGDGAHIYPLDLTISPRYEILQPNSSLGEGSFGSVFRSKVIHQDNTIIAAAKMSKEITTFPAENRLLIVRLAILEAAKLKSLCHANIVRGIGFLTEETRILLFMELMSESVRQKIDRLPRNCLDEDEALKIFQDVLEGLAYLHSRKPKSIVHRDVKCSNILLNTAGVAKLGDIGLMKTVALKNTGSTLLTETPQGQPGTIFFKAPEVLISENYGRKADVWSVGCALVEMLTGQPPNSNMDSHRWIIALNTGTISYKARDLVPDASVKVEEILEKTFRRRTKATDIETVGINTELRPYSWELLHDVIEMLELRPAQNDYEKHQRKENDIKADICEHFQEMTVQKVDVYQTGEKVEQIQRLLEEAQHERDLAHEKAARLLEALEKKQEIAAKTSTAIATAYGVLEKAHQHLEAVKSEYFSTVQDQ